VPRIWSFFARLSSIVAPFGRGRRRDREAAALTDELRDRGHVGRFGPLRALALLEGDTRAFDE
jgi:hypothetical protein